MYRVKPKDENNEISVIVEISKNSDPVKYEICKDTGLLKVDRFINVSMSYPCNYGFIPNTLGGDLDPIDALVVSEFPIQPSAMIKCKVIGVLVMEDESGQDEKIIAVAADKIDINSRNINDIEDIPSSVLRKIYHFFERYKDLDANKWVRVLGTQDRASALEIIDKSISSFENQKNIT